MTWAHRDGGGVVRETVAVQLKIDGEPVGWVWPDDIAALMNGDLTEAGIVALARLAPEPPEGIVIAPGPTWECFRLEEDRAP